MFVCQALKTIAVMILKTKKNLKRHWVWWCYICIWKQVTFCWKYRQTFTTWPQKVQDLYNLLHISVMNVKSDLLMQTYQNVTFYPNMAPDWNFEKSMNQHCFLLWMTYSGKVLNNLTNYFKLYSRKTIFAFLSMSSYPLNAVVHVHMRVWKMKFPPTLIWASTCSCTLLTDSVG